MAKITERMKELFETVGTVALGTSTPNGVPNVVPVDAKKIIDDETIQMLLNRGQVTPPCPS